MQGVRWRLAENELVSSGKSAEMPKAEPHRDLSYGRLIRRGGLQCATRQMHPPLREVLVGADADVELAALAQRSFWYTNRFT